LPWMRKRETAGMTLRRGFRGTAWIHRTVAGIASIERDIAVALACAAVALLVFAKLAREVVEGERMAFDERLILALRNPANLSDPIGPLWFEEAVRDFTALGSTAVLTLVTLLVFGFLSISRKHRAALFVIGSVAGGVVVANLLKFTFSRPRPALVPHAAEVYTLSFPSSHAMMSAVVYLTLGLLLARAEERIGLKLYFIIVAGFLTVLVGLSRIYLGVHWPSDVLAGWAVGASWACMCWLAMVLLQREGKVERAPTGVAPSARQRP
jgi:undecaprenyl-diphosphatase